MEVTYWIIAIVITLVSGGLSILYQMTRKQDTKSKDKDVNVEDVVKKETKEVTDETVTETTNATEDEAAEETTAEVALEKETAEEIKTVASEVSETAEAVAKDVSESNKLGKWDYIFQAIACVAALGMFYVLRDKKEPIAECYMNLIAFLWLYVIAVIDFKERIIPNRMILLGLAGWIIYFAVRVMVDGNDVSAVAKFSGGGLAFGAGVFLISALIVRGGIGMGDIKMFAVLGVLFGFSGVFTILFFTLIILFVVGLVMLIAGKANKKSEFPMAPFVLVGLALTILL